MAQTQTTQMPIKQTARRVSPRDLLDDPNIVTVTVSQAATILGLAKSTAHKNYKKTGFLLDGDLVPVLVCGSRTIVAIANLRKVLDHPSPAQPFTFGPSAVDDAITARRLAE